MNYRKAVLLDGETSTTAGTKTIDLKGLDPISRLFIMKSGTNSSSTPTAHPAKMVTKIELVDGSDILWSQSGVEAQALNWYQTGKAPVNIMSYLNDNICRAVFAINFGRWLWDEDLAFDPARFKNAQLKITHDGDAGGCAPDANTLDVMAEMFDEKRVNPIGWLMAKEYYTYTLTASAVETIDLPTDYVMRQILIESLAAGYAPNTNMSKFKLSENNGKKVPIEEGISDLIKQTQHDFGAYEEQIQLRGAASEVTGYCTPTYETYGSLASWDGNNGYACIHEPYGGQLKFTANTPLDLCGIIAGYCPHGAVAIPMGDLWDAGAWYDVTKLAKLEAKITAGSGASGTCQLITEQLRRY